MFGGYSIAVKDDIRSLAPFWDELAKDDILLSSQYLEVLEKAPLEDIKYKYGVVLRDDQSVGIIYWQVKKFSLSQSLNIHSHSNNFIDKIFTSVKKWGAKMINDNLLVVGNVSLTGDYGYRFCDSVDDNLHAPLVHGASKAIIDLAKSYGIKIKTIMVKDFELADDRLSSKFQHAEYTPYSADPTMIVEIDPQWKSFDDYLSAMKSKARVRVRRAKKLGQSFVVKTLSLDDLKQNSQTIYNLYLKIAAYSTFNLFTLHPDYFVMLKQSLGDAVEIFGVYLDGEFVAFYSTIRDGDQMHGHFLGYEQSLNKDYQLYLNMLYWLMEKAIDNNVQSLELSRTALEIKSSIGAEPHHLAVYTHAHNKLLNRMMKKVVPYFIPDNTWRARSPFKEVKGN